MNHMLFANKLFLGTISFAAFSLLCSSCNQTAKQPVQNYQFLEQSVSQSEVKFTSFEEKIDPAVISDENKQNANQELYQNGALGIGFAKPEGIQIQATDSVLSIWTAADFEHIEEFIEATPLLIRIEDNPDNLTAQEWLSSSSYLLDGIVEEQVAGNRQGIRFDWSGMWTYTSIAVPHPTRQTMVIITWDSDMSDYEMLFEGIVSSLEFI
jgi:hypothetical protein